MKKLVRIIRMENKPKSFFQSPSYVKMFALCFIFSTLQLRSVAQCNTFMNADTSNPVLNALPAGQTIESLDFVDIDGDGKLDCYVIPTVGFPQLYRNTGSKERPQFEKGNVSGFEHVITPAGSPVIQFVDIDGDADYDCFITEVNYGFRPVTAVRFYRNTGTRNKPQFVEDNMNNPVDFARTDNNFVKFYFTDIDNDGDLDFYYTGFYNTTLNDFDQCTYLNKGTAQKADYVLYTNDHPHDFERQRTYFDWNGDGLPDYVKYESILNKYEYLMNAGPADMPEFTSGMNAPVFTNGMPFRIVDLNNDGAPEALTSNGHYSTVAPISAVKAIERKIGRVSITKLSSAYQSAAYTYRWQYNDKDLAGSKPFIFAIKPGRYVLFVTDKCGTGVSLPFVVKKQAGNAEITDKNNMDRIDLSAVSVTTVKAYPNPFKNEIQVQLPSSKTASTIRITDLAGRVMLLQTTSSQTVLVGRNLPAGTYLLQVITADKAIVFHTTVIKE